MIHQYVNNGYHIVLDVNSGCVHVVDEMTYRVIPVVEEALVWQAEAEKAPAGQTEAEAEAVDELTAYVVGKLSKDGGETPDHEELKEVIGEILELKEAGMLYTEDIYEKYISEFKNRETVVKALCLHIAHDCNLACRYCFAEFPYSSLILHPD